MPPHRSRRRALAVSVHDRSDMAQITTRGKLVTLINVFTVEPAKQNDLIEVLTRATDETIRHFPGFISANIHKSLDGRRVTNYAQWRSRQDLEKMLRDPVAQPHLQEAQDLATTFDPQLYEVVAAKSRRRGPGRVALGAAASGAMALGAFAIGAMAIGRLAIGAIGVRRARVRALSLGDVTIGRLAVRELAVERGPSLLSRGR
jgi:quinol monooxygenase YgiN